MTDRNDDTVGYGRPPKSTQFKPGQSGNPCGRPKGARNFRTELLEELAEPITINDGDRDLTITKQRAFVKTLVRAAIGGNVRACGTLLSLCEKLDHADNEDNVELAPADCEIVNAFTARERKRREKQLGDDTSPGSGEQGG
jgi:hypothetical protein